MQWLRLAVYGAFALFGVGLAVTAESMSGRVFGCVMAVLGLVSVVMAIVELRKKRRAQRPERPEA